MHKRLSHFGVWAAMALIALPLDSQVIDRRASAVAEAAAIVGGNDITDGSQSLRKNKKHKIKGFFRRAAARKTPVRRGAPSTDVTIHAVVYSYDDSPTGVYSLKTTSPELTPVFINDDIDSEYGGVMTDEFYFHVDGARYAHKWNPADWTETVSGPSEFINGTAMAVDPTGGDVYACVYPMSLGSVKLEDSMRLVTIDTDEFVRASNIAGLESGFSAMFFTGAGALYGLDSEGGLYLVDKDSGTVSLMGSTGIELYYGGSAIVDPKSGAVFVAANGDSAVGLYELNVAEASALLLYEFEEDVVLQSMFFMPEKVSDDVPAKCESVEPVFDGGALAGHMKVAVPSVTAGGSALTGTLNYRFTCGEASIDGTAEAGSSIEIPFTAPEAGLYSYSLTFSNASGEGPAAKGSVWIGPDVPSPAADVKLVREDGKNVVSWTAVTTGVHNGWVDYDNMTYTVTRLTDGKKFEGITGTTFEDAVAETPQPEFYTYTVTAVSGGLVSAAAESNYVVVGAVYYNGFDSSADFATMTSTTLVREGSEWEWVSWHGAAAVSYDEYSALEAWLFSPELTLEGGKSYNLTFKTWGSHEEYSERLSVYIADSNNAATLYQHGTPVVDRMVINWEKGDARVIEATFDCPATGTYYIAFRGCSPADLGTIYLDEVTLSKAPVVAFPSAPAISVSREGDLGASVTVTAPSTDTEGNPLASLISVILSRDAAVVHTFDAPAPGEVLTWSETLPAAGSYTYSAVAVGANGRSEAASAVIVADAVALPSAPTGVALVETADDGVVTVSWNVPSTDVKGNALDTSTLTFSIYADGSNEAEATGLTGTSHTFTAVPAGNQEYVSYRVAAVNEAGQGALSRATDPVAVGTPSAVPYIESFAGAEFTNLWIMDDNSDYSDAEWILTALSETPEAAPQDGDGGMLAFYGEYLNDAATLTSGKIAIGPGANPTLTFWYFAQNSREGKDELTVLVDGGSGFRAVDQFSMRDEQKDGWTKRTVVLSGYEGKTIRLRLRGESFRTDNFLLIDNITIGNAGDDLQATSIVAPYTVPAGNEFNIEALVTNNGVVTMSDYAVKLFRNGEQVAVMRGKTVAPGSAALHLFVEKSGASWDADNEYYFTVDAVSDTDLSNNVSEKRTVKVTPNTYPTVSGLSAVYTDDDCDAVALTWDAPGTGSQTDGAFTENFESFNNFEINPACDWTFVDGDGNPTFGSSMFPFEGMTTPMAYIVLNSDHFNISYMAHSGKKYLAAFNSQTGNSDDWMISPELYGEVQTISFYARSYSDTYGLESFEILASTDGTSRENFTLVKAVKDVPVEWTEFTAELPAGTQHFAIRCTSKEVFAMFVDDVTYIPYRNPAADFEILGYNVYCQGKKINDAPVSGTSFTHTEVIDGAVPVYAVSVVYDRGESPLCDGVSPVMGGVEGIGADGITVSAADGQIIVTASQPVAVAVHSASGASVYTAEVAAGVTRISVAKGVYVVQAGETVAKVAVR